ncbi:meckelin [Apis mellifera]|uniref:Meckelin n=1 Tax=Apis mellifera TaxID=7460 RepID=A0A7M7L293_APIME|nr:meckelin [Apis mellifera]|eukprot:XP_026296669.1 meckelin [Apis mellifera]
MCYCIKRYIFFYLLIYYINFVLIVIANKELFEFSEPSKCKNNEHFDIVTLSCIECDVNKNLKPSDDRLRCICNKFSKKIGFKDGYPICISCGINATVTSDGNDCISCNNATCICSSNEIQVDRNLDGTLLDTMYCISCVNNTYPFLTGSKCLPCKNFEYNYYESDTYFTKYYYTLIQNYCLYKNPFDKLACEYLSNICVLSLYSNDIACKFFMKKQKASIWLFYNKNETTTILNSKQITQNYSFIKESNDNILNFTIVTFSLHGNLKFIGKPNIPCNLLEHVRFGIDFEKKCKLSIKNLMQEKMEFMYPYLTFTKNNNNLMYALPILIDYNKISDWQLVRKFFFIDNISGFKRLSNFTINDSDEKEDKLSVLRYMKSLNIIIGVLLVLALPLSGIKTLNYIKQHHTSSINIFVVIWFFIYTMSTIGNIIILCLIILCLYLFIFYKGSTIPCIFFPEDINEKMIKTFTVIAFFSKFIEILGFICQYWNIDIFFIDWEQPKIINNQCKHDLPYLSINEFYINKFSKNKHFQMTSEIITAKRKKILYKLKKYENSKNFNKSFSVDKQKTENSISKISTQIINKDSNFDNLPISIWRTYFIANKWLNLQTKRKINIMIQLLAVLCIFQIIQLCPWIIGIPELTSIFSENNYDFILYYTICTLIYILIYCIHWLVSIVFFEQCITNRMQEFVNLCSVANISVFILPFNYYGFYIHGRSVHGFADTDLPTLINNLQMEKNNLCAHRGLVPGTTQQTFILYLTKTFRITFNKNLKLTNIKRHNFINNFYSATTNWEYIFNNQLKIKQFLCKFVDHCIENEDYIIKEQHFLEKLFNIFFYNEEKSIFYIDNNYSFNQVLLYGNEWLFATFEISIFILIIVLCNNSTLAIVVTILVSTLLTLIVKQSGKKNISNHILLNRIFFT